MITCKISAGSSTIVQDIIDMCLSLAPIGNWQGFVYNSTTGSKPWCVWAQRMDEDAHELQYVYSSGLAAPPDAYELITVTCPTTTGFTLSFTSVNSMPSVVQTRDSGAGAPSVSANGNIVTIKMSAAASSALADFLTIVTNIGQANSTLFKCYYISSGGNKPWAVYAVRNTYNGAGSAVGSIFIYTMGAMAAPPAGSEALTIAAPSTTTLNTDGFTALTGPLLINAK